MRALRAAALLSALLLAGCGAESGGERASEGVYDDRVDYGVIADLSGPTTASQVPFLHGIEARVAEANAGGGVNGRTIKLLTEDEKYQVDTGLAAYKKLVDQTPVVGITGLSNGSLQVAAAEQIDRNAVPIVGPYSTTKAALNPFKDYFFGLECSYADQADVAVPYMIERTGAERPRVSVVSLDVESGYEWAELVESRVKEAGGEFLGHQTLAPDATEADGVVQKLAAQRPDFVALHGSPGTATIVLTSLAKFDLDVPVIGIFGTGSAEAYGAVSKEVGGNFEFVHCYTPASIDTEGAQQLKAAAEEHGYRDDLAKIEFVNGWVVGEVVVEALDRAGEELDREAFKEALASIEDLDTGGLSEPVSFGPRDRAGIQTVRPYRFDYGAGEIVPVGDYADYEELITSEYIPGS